MEPASRTVPDDIQGALVHIWAYMGDLALVGIAASLFRTPALVATIHRALLSSVAAVAYAEPNRVRDRSEEKRDMQPVCRDLFYCDAEPSTPAADRNRAPVHVVAMRLSHRTGAGYIRLRPKARNYG